MVLRLRWMNDNRIQRMASTHAYTHTHIYIYSPDPGGVYKHLPMITVEHAHLEAVLPLCAELVLLRLQVPI